MDFDWRCWGFGFGGVRVGLCDNRVASPVVSAVIAHVLTAAGTIAFAMKTAKTTKSTEIASVMTKMQLATIHARVMRTALNALTAYATIRI